MPILNSREQEVSNPNILAGRCERWQNHNLVVDANLFRVPHGESEDPPGSLGTDAPRDQAGLNTHGHRPKSPDPLL
jgi:hypothetical protein